MIECTQNIESMLFASFLFSSEPSSNCSSYLEHTKSFRRCQVNLSLHSLLSESSCLWFDLQSYFKICTMQTLSTFYRYRIEYRGVVSMKDTYYKYNREMESPDLMSGFFKPYSLSTLRCCSTLKWRRFWYMLPCVNLNVKVRRHLPCLDYNSWNELQRQKQTVFELSDLIHSNSKHSN